MNRIQTKALVEGAIFAGITALIGILYFYAQYLGILAMLWPVPVIIVGYRNGLKASILSAMSAGLIVSLLTHPLVGVGLLVGFGLPGVLMGYMINKRMNPYAVVFLCGIVLSFTIVGEFLISLKASGIDLVKFLASLDTTFKQSMEMSLKLYRQMGMAEKDLKRFSDTFGQAIGMMKLIFPSAVIVSGFIFAFIDYKITRLILKRIGNNIIPDIEDFSRWRLQEPYSFIMLGLVVVAVAASYFKLPGMTAVALNVTTVLMLIFSVIGISVLVYYSRIFGERQGIPKALRNIIVVIIVLTFMQALALVGILDLVLNFRKLESKNPGGAR